MYYFKRKKNAFKHHLEVNSEAEQLGLFAKTEVWDRRGILRHYYDINKQSNEIVISVFISSKKKNTIFFVGPRWRDGKSQL